MRRAYQIICFAALWLGLAASAHADKRVALVIGNSAYQNVAALTNPINDANAIAASLTRLGFTVTSQTDLGFDGMRRALRDFSSAARGSDLAIIYFAGHGMEIGGQNYLVPTDARLASDGDVPYEAISLELALSALDGARGTRLLLLDACRDNPFAAKMKVGGDKSRSIGRGLARVEPSVGTLVAYAAKEGTTAEDGDSGHSPFARALLEHIEEPGIDIQFLFREVRDSVLAETNGDQEPFTYGSLPGKAVYLNPAAAPVAVTTPAPAVTPAPESPPAHAAEPAGGDELAADVAFWNSIKDTNDRALLESYLKQYPNGRFAPLATIFVSRLDAKAAPPASEAPPVVAAPPPGAADGSPPASEVAALPEPPATPATTPAAPPPDLVLNIQTELVRVGCGRFTPDGNWGKQSRGALHDFIRYAKLNPGTDDPSEEYLAALKGHSDRVCPLVCGPRFDAKGDQCVLKTCPARMVLGPGGDCAPLKPVIKRADRTQTGGGGSSSRCHEESVQQCVDRTMNSERANTHGHVDDLAVQTACTNPSRRIQICR